MLFKKKATSKTVKKRSKKIATTEDKPTTTTKATPPPEPPDPFKAIQEREAAAQAPTRAVESGEVKPPESKPKDTAKPGTENMTGPEQMQVTIAGGEQLNPAGPNLPGPGQATPKK